MPTMQDLLKALPHLVTAVVVIAASVVLASEGIITGGEAIGLIGTAGGFTLGGTVASGSISTAARAAVDVSHSASEQSTTTPTPSSTSQTTPTGGSQVTAWNDTQEGQSIRTTWENLRDTYKTKVPGHTDQLRTLAQRPIDR